MPPKKGAPPPEKKMSVEFMNSWMEPGQLSFKANQLCILPEGSFARSMNEDKVFQPGGLLELIGSRENWNVREVAFQVALALSGNPASLVTQAFAVKRLADDPDHFGIVDGMNRLEVLKHWEKQGVIKLSEFQVTSCYWNEGLTRSVQVIANCFKAETAPLVTYNYGHCTFPSLLEQAERTQRGLKARRGSPKGF